MVMLGANDDDGGTATTPAMPAASPVSDDSLVPQRAGAAQPGLHAVVARDARDYARDASDDGEDRDGGHQVQLIKTAGAAPPVVTYDAAARMFALDGAPRIGAAELRRRWCGPAPPPTHTLPPSVRPSVTDSVSPTHILRPRHNPPHPQ